MSWATSRLRSLDHPRRSRRRHALRRRHRPPARGGWTSPGNGGIASTQPRAPTAPGSLAGMSLQVSGVASAASFGGSGERAPPAVQRAALEQARSHGSSCTLRDLGCHHPLASSRTMTQPARLQQVQPKSAATRADATTRPCVELAYSQGCNNALPVCSPGSRSMSSRPGSGTRTGHHARGLRSRDPLSRGCRGGHFRRCGQCGFGEATRTSARMPAGGNPIPLPFRNGAQVSPGQAG